MDITAVLHGIEIAFAVVIAVSAAIAGLGNALVKIDNPTAKKYGTALEQLGLNIKGFVDTLRKKKDEVKTDEENK